MRSRSFDLVRAMLVTSAVIAVFFAPAILTPAQFLYRDSGRMHHAVKSWIAQELRNGHFPQWNPWGGLGYPMVAGAVDGVQHPFNLLFLLLPFETAFKAWVLLSFLVAGTGAYYWARQLGVAFGPALLAGLGFTLSGFLVSSTDNLTYLSTLATLPWLLGAAHAWLRDSGVARLALLGAASAMTAAAGDLQSWGFAVAALPLYGAVLGRSGDRGAWRGAARGILGALTCAVAAAPFILPVAAWLPESTRGEAFDAPEYQRFNLLPWRVIELFVPHLLRDRQVGIWSDLYETYSASPYTPLPWVLSEYVGAASLALAFLGAARSRVARLLLALAGVAVWMAMGSYAGFGQLARHLPVLSSFRYWEKAAFWAHLLVPVAAAYGLTALNERIPSLRRFIVGTATAAALLLSAHTAARVFQPTLASAVMLQNHRVEAETLASNLTDGTLHAGLALALLSLVVLIALRGRAPRLAMALAVGVAITDLAAVNVRAYVLYAPETVKAEGPIASFVTHFPGLQRLIAPYPLVASSRSLLSARSDSSGGQTADVAWVLGSRSLASGFNVGVVGNFETYTAMIPARQMRFLRRSGLTHQLPNAGMWSVRWLVIPGEPVRAGEMGLPPPYRVVATDPVVGLTLLEVPHRSRAYMASDLTSVDRRQAMEFVLDGNSFASSRSVVEAPIPLDYHSPRGETRIMHDEPERVTLETNSDGLGLVVLNDVYASGWSATVDGHPAEILPANYMARGVWVRAGVHTVEFRYRTPLLREAWALFFAGALGLGLWALERKRQAVVNSVP